MTAVESQVFAFDAPQIACFCGVVWADVAAPMASLSEYFGAHRVEVQFRCVRCRRNIRVRWSRFEILLESLRRTDKRGAIIGA